MALIAGVARADVTPPVGIMMSGYAARKTPSIGIHDDLAATALYLECGETRAAIVSLDLIGVRAEELAAVRACCQEAAGVPGENVFVACSHTHGGPVIGPEEGNPLRTAYAETVRWKIAGALSEARGRAVPARIATGRKEALVAGNRREHRPDGQTVLGFNPDGPTTRHTDVIRVDAAETGQTMAVLFQYGCHGTALTQGNYWITADYMGVARRFAERELPGTRAMFVGGCGGNQNPYPRGTFELCQRHGTRLGAAVVAAALDPNETHEVARLVNLQHDCRLPLADLPSVEACRDAVAQAEAAAAAEQQRAAAGAGPQSPAYDAKIPLSWATDNALRAARERLAAAERGEKDLFVPITLQVLALDDIALVSLPAEVFREIGEEIRARSPFALTLPVDYANGSIGYVPTQAEIPFGGYEVTAARARRFGLFLRDDADAALIEGALAALRRAKG